MNKKGTSLILTGAALIRYAKEKNNLSYWWFCYCGRHYNHKLDEVNPQMIDTQLISLLAVLIESIGILTVERKTAVLLGLVTILTVIIFFIIK